MNLYKEQGYVTNPQDLLKPTFEQVDTNQSGKLSNDEIRKAAFDAGIDGWESKQIKTLKKTLGL